MLKLIRARFLEPKISKDVHCLYLDLNVLDNGVLITFLLVSKQLGCT